MDQLGYQDRSYLIAATGLRVGELLALRWARSILRTARWPFPSRARPI